MAETIHGETEGNPLFVSELVRLLGADGRLAEQKAGLGIPSGIRSVIGQRVSRLSAGCRDLLAPASVLGREFELETLSRLTATSTDELIDVLDEAMSERVLGEVPGSPGRVRFAHALIRDVLYDEVTPARRLRLHRQAGEALEAVYSDDLEPHLAELVPHFVMAAPVIGPDKAIDYARRAADRAATQLAYEEAARLYEMALALVDAGAVRCDLLLALGRARSRAGDTPAAKDTFRSAAEMAEAEGLADRLARAALGYGSGAIIWEVSRDDEYLVPLLERALDALGDRDAPLRVRLLARLAGGPLRDASFPPSASSRSARRRSSWPGSSTTRQRSPTLSSATSSPVTPRHTRSTSSRPAPSSSRWPPAPATRNGSSTDTTIAFRDCSRSAT